MLVGTDMFLTLPEWRRAEDIFRLADIVLMRREKLDETGRLIAEKKLGYERDFWREDSYYRRGTARDVLDRAA